MGLDRGLVDMIRQSLTNEHISVRTLSHNTSAILKDLSQAGTAHRFDEGPYPGRVITHRSRPEFILLPIGQTPEYLQALAEHAAKQAAEASGDIPLPSDADIAKAIDSP